MITISIIQLTFCGFCPLKKCALPLGTCSRQQQQQKVYIYIYVCVYIYIYIQRVSLLHLPLEIIFITCTHSISQVRKESKYMTRVPPDEYSTAGHPRIFHLYPFTFAIYAKNMVFLLSGVQILCILYSSEERLLRIVMSSQHSSCSLRVKLSLPS